MSTYHETINRNFIMFIEVTMNYTPKCDYARWLSSELFEDIKPTCRQIICCDIDRIERITELPLALSFLAIEKEESLDNLLEMPKDKIKEICGEHSVSSVIAWYREIQDEYRNMYKEVCKLITEYYKDDVEGLQHFYRYNTIIES